MASPAQIILSCTLNGVGVSQTIAEPISGVMTESIVIPAAKAGTIASSILTLSTGHGINTGDRIDVYWGTGKHIGCLVGTVSGNSVPISAGAGDALPTGGAIISCMVPIVKPFAVLAVNMNVILLSCASATEAVAAFADVTPTAKGTLSITPSGSYVWYRDSGLTNPVSADPTQVFLSHGDITSPRTFQLVVGVA